MMYPIVFSIVQENFLANSNSFDSKTRASEQAQRLGKMIPTRKEAYAMFPVYEKDCQWISLKQQSWANIFTSCFAIGLWWLRVVGISCVVTHFCRIDDPSFVGREVVIQTPKSCRCTGRIQYIVKFQGLIRIDSHIRCIIRGEKFSDVFCKNRGGD